MNEGIFAHENQPIYSDHTSGLLAFSTPSQTLFLFINLGFKIFI